METAVLRLLLGTRAGIMKFMLMHDCLDDVTRLEVNEGGHL